MKPCRLLALFASLLLGCNLTVETRPTLSSRTIAAGTGGCVAGGQEILLGVDSNENGVLEDEELSGNTTVCFPQSGTGGGGQNIAISAVPVVSTNATCSALEISVGVDENTNSVLEGSEVRSTTQACLPIPEMANNDLATVQTRVENLDTNVPDSFIVQPGTAFPDIKAVLDALRGKRFTKDIEVTVLAGEYTHDSPLVLNHPDGNKIVFLAPNRVVLRFPQSSGIIVPAGNSVSFFGEFFDIEYSATTRDPTTVGIMIEENAFATMQRLRVAGFGRSQIEVRGGTLRSGNDFPDTLDNIQLECSIQAGEVCEAGLRVHRGGVVFTPNVSSSGSTVGFWVYSGGVLSANGAVAIGATTGFLVDEGGVITSRVTLDSRIPTVSNDVGYQIQNGGILVYTGWDRVPVGDSNQTDIEVRDGGILRAIPADGGSVNCGTSIVCDSSAILRGCTANCTATPL